MTVTGSARHSVCHTVVLFFSLGNSNSAFVLLCACVIGLLIALGRIHGL
jgi:hypothetical protein